MLSELFAALLRMTLFGGAATLLAGLACLVLRQAKAPRAVCCVLWLAVLVCLLCPVGIPVRLSAQTPAAQAAGQALAQWEQTALADLPTGQDALADAAPADPAQAGQLALAALWAAGCLGLLGLALVDDRKLHRKVALAYRVQTPQGDTYYTGSGVTTPFVAGLLHPRIYLPAGLNAGQQQHILLHEQAHLRRRDNWVKPLFYLALCLHWANPLVWLAYRQMLLDMEAACDEAVLRQLGSGVKAEYCQSLLQFAFSGSPIASPLAFGESSTKARVRHILGYRRPRAAASTACLLAACAVAALCLIRPVYSAQAASAPSASAAASPGSLSPSPAALAASAQSSPAAAVAEQPAAASLAWPVPDYTYCSRWMSDAHMGVDICAPKGTDIVAAAGGTVLLADYGSESLQDESAAGDAASQAGVPSLSGYGYLVILAHPDGSLTLYAHCDSLAVAEGDQVEQGQVIATVGSTGASTGNHCHFEIIREGERVPPQELFPDHARA